MDPLPTDPKPGEPLSDGWTVKSFTRYKTGWKVEAVAPDGTTTAEWSGTTPDPRKNVYWKLYGGR